MTGNHCEHSWSVAESQLLGLAESLYAQAGHGGKVTWTSTPLSEIPEAVSGLPEPTGSTAAGDLAGQNLQVPPVQVCRCRP